MTDINRVGAGWRLRVREMISDLGKALAKEVQNAGLDTQRTDWQRARLRGLIEEADRVISGAFEGISKDHAEQIRGLIQVSTDKLTLALNWALGADLVQPVAWTRQQLDAIASDILIDGAPSAEWWSSQDLGVRDAFKRTMREGLLRGESIGQLTQRVKAPGVGLTDRAARGAEALARTSAITTANHAHLALYRENADITGGVVWDATLDPSTCSSCGKLDGQIWKLEEKHPIPALHFGCRCALLPQTLTWEQLARNAGGDTRLARELDKMPKGDRASMGGPVSGNMTYQEWFKGQSPERQKDILGPGRFKLYEAGKIGFSDLVDGIGNPLTLKQLAQSGRK